MPVPLAFGREKEVPSSTPPSAPSAEPKPEQRFELRTPAAKQSLDPLGPARYKLQLTASQQLHDKLQRARDLMRHELPDGDLAQIVERALDLLVADRMKRRFGVGRKPRTKPEQKARTPQSDNRHIPHEIRREVVARDDARCSFVSSDGRRWAAHGWLELHHEQPFGRGGPATTKNIRILCRAHNQLLAERDYGRAFIQQRIQEVKRAAKPHELVPGPAR